MTRSSVLKRGLSSALRRVARGLTPEPSQSGAAEIVRGSGFSRSVEVFDTFRDSAGREYELLTGYRNHIKGRWQGFFWPVRVLSDLDRRGVLPERLMPLRERLKTERTLPVCADEIAKELSDALGPDSTLVLRTDTLADYTETPVFVVVPTEDEVVELRHAWLQKAQSVLRGIWNADRSFSGMRALEVGTGRGYFCYALVELGFQDAIGIDVEPAFYPMIAEQPRVTAAFAEVTPGIHDRVRLEHGDCHALQYDDASFDFISSNSVLEHIRDLPAALREMARVLKLGGIAWHSVNPWCGPNGGHSLCTMDFPWGHVLLTADKAHEYFRRFRPFEAQAASGFYNAGFQAPRLTLAEVERAILDAGFEILEWVEEKHRYADHYSRVDAELLAMCRLRHPAVAVRDLMTAGLRLTLRRR